MLPYEAFLAVKQTDIGCITDPKYEYNLRVTNQLPIRSQAMKLQPEEEEWLENYLRELVGKGVIVPLQ